MNAFTFRAITTLLTFVIGVGIATAWVLASKEPAIRPVELPTENATTVGTLEMVFVLDTTGSMGGLLDGAKQRIWGIVNDVMQTESHPAVRIGLVAYRDRGDQYVTQVLPLTNDLDQVYTTLMGYQANGGGDTEEDVRTALLEGVRQAGWSQRSRDVSQILFLVGDAPPHENYVDVPATSTTAAEASRKGIIVNTIQCGNLQATRPIWQTIAQVGQGQYFSIAQDGGVEAIATPFDAQLGDLATRLGSTYVAYGGGAGAGGDEYRARVKRAAGLAETAVADSAPPVARAERALNKAVNANAYIGDLLQNIENGSVKLEAVKDEDLPEELRKLSPEERRKEVDRRLAERREIRAQILSLSKQRGDFIAAERKKLGAKDTGFDSAVAAALKEQMARKK